ncbi:MAG: hypothetical protein H6R04_1247 [Burkholderiaceae bacterium]|nr:hypothetical protein [Burkholderiaceae bacterium]
METKAHLQERGILKQCPMQQKAPKAANVWSNEGIIEDILDDYLKKSGYLASYSDAGKTVINAMDYLRRKKILELYRMRSRESVSAWGKKYRIGDILDDYLEKSGYPTSYKRVA